MKWLQIIGNKIMHIFLVSLAFISIRYIIISCKFAFQEDLIFIFLFALDIYIIGNYWVYLTKHIPNKYARAAVLSIALIILAAFVYFYGYLEISPAIRKW